MLVLLTLSGLDARADEEHSSISLDWSMQVEKDSLVVDYVITNQLARPIHVVDTVTHRGVKLPDRLIVGPEEMLWQRKPSRSERIGFVKEDRQWRKYPAL